MAAYSWIARSKVAPSGDANLSDWFESVVSLRSRATGRGAENSDSKTQTKSLQNFDALGVDALSDTIV